jgi:hypothetical protein
MPRNSLRVWRSFVIDSYLQFDFHFWLDSELFPTSDQIPPFPGLVSLIDHLSANHRPNHLRGPKLLRRHGKNVTIH